MRVVTWLVLVTLTALALLHGHIAFALLVAGTKALVLGMEFMELRHAAREHAAAYAAFMVLLVGVLEVMVR